MSLICRRLLDQRFLRSARGKLGSQASRITVIPCKQSLHKKSGSPSGRISFTWGQRIFKGFSIVVIVEVVFLGVAYVQWSMMNRDPDYRSVFIVLFHRDATTIIRVSKSQLWPCRYKMTQSSIGSVMLEGYYAFGEQMDPSNKIREHDVKLWRMQGRNVWVRESLEQCWLVTAGSFLSKWLWYPYILWQCHNCRSFMAVVCSEIGDDFPLQGIQDHLFDSGDENEEEESCECAFKMYFPKIHLLPWTMYHYPRCRDNIWSDSKEAQCPFLFDHNISLHKQQCWPCRAPGLQTIW